jgi:hypothetical protein
MGWISMRRCGFGNGVSIHDWGRSRDCDVCVWASTKQDVLCKKVAVKKIWIRSNEDTFCFIS